MLPSPRHLLDDLLDRSILFSFDRNGYLRHRRRFRRGELDVDLAGRTCLVTGANSGLGRATALGLAARGAEVWLACRSSRRGEAARDEIRLATGNPAVHAIPVDLSERASVRAMARRLRPTTLDLLVHNAGVLLDVREETSDGLERTFATHFVGPHLLTRLMLSRLRRAERPRVLFVSSGGMYGARLEVDDPQWLDRPWNGVRAYAETKRAQVVLAELWAASEAGSGIVFHSMHPGWAKTPGVRRSLPRFFRLMEGRLRTPAEGADTVLWLAIAPRAAEVNGRFWFDRRPASTHLLPWTREDASARRALWRLCEELADRSGERSPARERRRREAAARGRSRSAPAAGGP